MYDAVAEAVPLADSGQHRKKALLIVSDGNDTNSQATVADVKRQIRATEVMVYAIGIDGQGSTVTYGGQGGGRQPRRPPSFPFPFPMPGGRRPPIVQPRSPTPAGRNREGEGRTRESRGAAGDHRRKRWPHGDRPQRPRPRSGDREHRRRAEQAGTSLGYPSTGKADGKWHTITVEVLRAGYHVRARRGYMATKD